MPLQREQRQEAELLGPHEVVVGDTEVVQAATQVVIHLHGSLAAPSLAPLHPHAHMALSLRHPWLRCVRTLTWLPRCAIPGSAASARSGHSRSREPASGAKCEDRTTSLPRMWNGGHVGVDVRPIDGRIRRRMHVSSRRVRFALYWLVFAVAVCAIAAIGSVIEHVVYAGHILPGVKID